MPEQKKPKPLHADHRARMQERVRRHGLESLAEHEVLEYLLFFAIPRKDTNALAHRLIQHFGDFCKVLEANEDQLCEVEGIGPASARLICLILETARYYNIKKRRPRPCLKNTGKAVEYLQPLFYGQQNELFYVIAMDEDMYPLRDLRVEEGLHNQVTVDYQKTVRMVVKTGCTRVILAHNHPTGLALASKGDMLSTMMLVKALGSVGIDVEDHIIICKEEYYSMREHGNFPRYDRATNGIRCE